jgi:hypothetical protein
MSELGVCRVGSRYSVVEMIGSRPGSEIAAIFCHELKYMCDLDREVASELAGVELLTLESYYFLLQEGGEGLVRDCLSDRWCIENMLNSINQAAPLFQESRYFFSLTLKDVKMVLKVLEKMIGEQSA